VTWRKLMFAVVLALLLLPISAAAPQGGPSFSSILAPLAVFAGSAIGTFVIAVGLDDLAGVLLALKEHKFDVHKLGSFLESQFGTRRAVALAGIVSTAITAAVGSALLHGGLTQAALQAIADAALAAASAGAAAMVLSVIADIFDKVGQLTGAAVPKPS